MIFVVKSRSMNLRRTGLRQTIGLRIITLAAVGVLLAASYLGELLVPSDAADHGFNGQDQDPTDLSFFSQTDPLSDFYLQPENQVQVVPVPVIQHPFSRWNAVQPEKFLDPSAPTSNHPSYFQDIERCPTVAIVLFPFHEFL